eukprot:2290571-Pleurochrysis_carterae.AAC.1
MADQHAPLWLLPHMRDALVATGAGSVTFAQCALDARARKYTTLVHSSTLSQRLDELERARCVHGTDTHPEVAYGRDQAGRAIAAQTAAYPRGMNEALAEALAGALRAREAEPGQAARADAAAVAPDGERATERGGRIAQGADLAGD